MMGNKTLAQHVALVELKSSSWGRWERKNKGFGLKHLGIKGEKASSVDLKSAFLLPGDVLGFCRHDFETFWNLLGFVSACWERSQLPGQGGRALLSDTALRSLSFGSLAAQAHPPRRCGAEVTQDDEIEALIDLHELNLHKETKTSGTK